MFIFKASKCAVTACNHTSQNRPPSIESSLSFEVEQEIPVLTKDMFCRMTSLWSNDLTFWLYGHVLFGVVVISPTRAWGRLQTSHRNENLSNSSEVLPLGFHSLRQTFGGADRTVMWVVMTYRGIGRDRQDFVDRNGFRT